MTTPDGAGARKPAQPPAAQAAPAASGQTPSGQPPSAQSQPQQEQAGRTVPTANVANLLTMTRLLLVPVFLLALFTEDGQAPGWRLLAAILFAVASITDHVDGWIARKYGLITDFGKLADPIADKALTGSALIGLSVLGELSWWVTLVIAVREIGVTVLRFWVIRHGVIPASRGGKAKTVAQILAIGLYLLPLPASMDVVSVVVMGAAVALTVITGLDYVLRAARLRARVPQERG